MAKTRASATSEDAVWLSQGSCVRLDVTVGLRPLENGNITVLVVSSGKIDTTMSENDKSLDKCKESIMEIGYEFLHNNPIDYVQSGKCSNPLAGPGGAADFDDLDAPIRPLQVLTL